MTSSKKDPSILTKFDLDAVFQTPYGAAFGTLEELAKCHQCTVEEIGVIADLADPVECVRAAMKLFVEKEGCTRTTLDTYLLRRNMLDLLSYALCGCEDALLIEEANFQAMPVEGEEVAVEPDDDCVFTVDGCFVIESQLLIETCRVLGLKVREGNMVHWFDIQDKAVDLNVEIVLRVFGLGIENELSEEGCEWLEFWEECKQDMRRIDALLQERPAK